MGNNKQIIIKHFSDVLCIWAYLGQIRLDELQEKFGDKISFEYHFIQVFGAVESKMNKNWKDKGGIQAYSQHVNDIAAQYPHIDIHPQLWTKNIPTSSASCHLFIKAVQHLDSLGELNMPVKDIIWQLRLAFFRDLIDISSLNEQLALAKRLSLPVDKITQQISSGAAFALLDEDLHDKENLRVSGSPTLVFNEGRQTLYGNVGYRLMEANINELLNDSELHFSWC